MGKFIALVYGIASYLLAVAVIVYFIGFEENTLVPKGIDDGVAGTVVTAVVINLALFALFVVQHTIMARPGFKEKWTKIVPQPVERSTFVLFAALIVILLMWQWRPIEGVVWNVENEIAVNLLIALNFVGWAIFFWATFLIDHFELFGVKQVFNNLRGAPPPSKAFKKPVLYKLCRHPMMLGFLIAFWATPSMSAGHLFFTAGITAYIFMGIWFEERDLVVALGERYKVYQQQIPKLLPLGRRGKSESEPDEQAS